VPTKRSLARASEQQREGPDDAARWGVVVVAVNVHVNVERSPKSHRDEKQRAPCGEKRFSLAFSGCGYAGVARRRTTVRRARRACRRARSNADEKCF
jgi:hypothetical protein